MSRIRSISDAHKLLVEEDPDTAVTEYFIRKLVTEGNIPSFKTGNKHLVDVDVLQVYLYGKKGGDAID